MQGADRVSSSWESLQRKAERQETWRGEKQVKARQRKQNLIRVKRNHAKFAAKPTRMAERKDFPAKMQWEKMNTALLLLSSNI